MPKHDADIRGRLAIVYNGETVTSKTNASNPQVGDPCRTLSATGAGRAVVIENHAKDVAMMLALLKVARIHNGDKMDSFIDLAGYAACAGEIVGKEAP